MTDRLVCLDTSIWIPYLIPEEQQDAATALVTDALQGDVALVAPSVAWSEVGSVLRKKVRAGTLVQAEASHHFRDLLSLPIAWIDSRVIRFRAWEIARQFSLSTLYDAAFMACTELALPPDEPIADRVYWTADRRFVAALGNQRPPYVRLLV